MEDTPLYTRNKTWKYFFYAFLGIDVLALAVGILFFSPLSTWASQVVDPVLHALDSALEQIPLGWTHFASGFWGVVPAVLLGQLLLVTVLYRGSFSTWSQLRLRERLLKVFCTLFFALMAYFSLIGITLTPGETTYPVWTAVCMLCASVMTVIALFMVIFDLD